MKRMAIVAAMLATGAMAAQAAEPPEASVAEPPASASIPEELLESPQRIRGAAVDPAQFPGYATVITAEEIRASHAGSIPELLNRYAGVTVMDTNGFGLGADSTVNLRGIVNSSRTGALVLVDGVRQNRVTGDEVHWQSIPIEQVERIEILRGGSSLIYGEGALAGLINIVMKHGAAKPFETEEEVEVGSFGQQRYAASARGRLGLVTYGTGYERRLVTGYRESTNSRTTTTTHHVGLDPLPTLHLDTNVLHSEDTSYFAGGITPDASQQRRRQRGSFSGFFDDHTTQVGVDTAFTGLEDLALEGSAFWRMRESDSVTTSRFATIAPSEGLSLRSRHRRRFDVVEHTLVSGIELLDEKATTGTRGSSKLSESNKGSYGLYAEETVRLWDRASLVAGLRYDRARFEEDITSPQFVGTLRFEGWSPKVAMSVDVAKPLTLYASYARPFKAPNVDDFAAAIPGDQFIGNIDLQPQQSDSYEIGLHARPPHVGALDAAWFYTKTHDEILFNNASFQSENFDTLRTGVETSFTPVLPIPHLTGRLTYTFTETEFRKGAFRHYQIPATPEHKWTATLAYEPLPHLVWSLDWLLVQEFFRVNDFKNTLRGNDYGVLNLGVRYTVKNVTAHFIIENVTNAEYTSFQSSNGVIPSTGENPAPPTTFRGGVTVRF